MASCNAPLIPWPSEGSASKIAVSKGTGSLLVFSIKLNVIVIILFYCNVYKLVMKEKKIHLF